MNLSRFTTAALFVLSCAFAQVVCAQSTDQTLPTPILSNDLNGKIVALDVGDPRATRHFYAFAASPGDLLVTVDSKNLNGDFDVFTAITFRPLMKTTVYSSSPSSAITKGIYLRAHQILILRVEARTPNDDPGTYHIRFGGTFEPFSGGIPVAENTETAETPTEKVSSNRLSSVGATIPRPSPEVTETAEAKPSPSPEKAAENPAEKTAESSNPKAKTTARNSPSSRRPARPSSRRQPPAKKPEPAKKTETETAAEAKVEPAKTEPEKTEAAKVEKPAEKPAETEKPTNAPPEKSKAQELSSQLPGTRLIIEEKDGTRIERPMSTVRRIIIEGPTIVILLKNGKSERIAMADVARMAIEPQQ